MDTLMVDDAFGTVVFRQNNRIKRYAIRVTGDSIIVQYPMGGTMNMAMAFLDQNREWVVSVLKKRVGKASIFFDESTQFETQSFRLLINGDSKGRFYGSFNRERDVLTIHYPSAEDVKSVSVQTAIRKI